LLTKGDLDGALAASQEAVRLNPTDPGTHIMLGWTLADRGDLVGAVEVYREAVRVDPTSAWAHATLGGGLLQATGDLDGALAAFREAVRLDPNSSARWSLGEAGRMRSVAHRLDAV